jgi:NADH:ubiquinone reductase (H+-translocating)
MTTMAIISRFLVLMMLTGFKTRISILFNWTVAFLGRGRAQQVITAQKVFARHALEVHGDESGAALPIPVTARRDGATP